MFVDNDLGAGLNAAATIGPVQLAAGSHLLEVAHASHVIGGQTVNGQMIPLPPVLVAELACFDVTVQ